MDENTFLIHLSAIAAFAFVILVGSCAIEEIHEDRRLAELIKASDNPIAVRCAWYDKGWEGLDPACIALVAKQ